VLEALDLHIADGEFLVLVGPSGCGKSTLLRLLAGLEVPSSGEIWVGDRPVSQLPPSRRDVAMVFQSYALYPHLSVSDNLAFGLRRSRPRTALQQLQDSLHRAGRRLPRGLRPPSAREERIEARGAEVAAMRELEPLLQRLLPEFELGPGMTEWRCETERLNLTLIFQWAACEPLLRLGRQELRPLREPSQAARIQRIAIGRD
jgi:multiple sugar transport system ATP-binding protein